MFLSLETKKVRKRRMKFESKAKGRIQKRGK